MEKLIALAQHLGLEVFECEGEHYTGATQEEFDSTAIELPEVSADEQLVFSDYTRLEDEITEATYDDSILEYGKKEYLVYTDEEADQAWDESIENFIDECVLPDLPDNYRRYFDNEAFKNDCRYDGRGHTLASYDGNEYTETVNGTAYYIYRTN